MITEILIFDIHNNYVSFFIFQAAFIALAIGSLILVKVLFKKLMSVLTKTITN
jgi:hypothetical protein